MPTIYKTRVFQFGFEKNVRDNITQKELQALRALSQEITKYTVSQLKTALEAGILFKVIP